MLVFSYVQIITWNGRVKGHDTQTNTNYEIKLGRYAVKNLKVIIQNTVLWQSYIRWTNERQTWWRHQMETFSALLAICAGNSPENLYPEWWFGVITIYRPEHVNFGLLCVIFKFPSRIFCRRVPGFATDCPCGVWCRGLTTCLLYVGPPLEF